MTSTKTLRSPRVTLALPFIGALLLTVLPVSAQFRGPDKELSKAGNAVRSAFKETVATPSKSTVFLRCEGKEVALATIVSEDGYLVTKASELKGDITCVTSNDSELPATLVGVSEENDLALLKLEAKKLPAIQWSDAKKPDVGQWVATTSPTDLPIAVGVLSVGRRKIAPRSGLLGVQLADGDGGAKVVQVVPDSPAEKCGIKVDDVITKVNEKAIESRDSLVSTIRSFSPGQQVNLAVVRAEKPLEFKATLVGGVGPAARAEIMNRMGGELSIRAANFPAVLQHDTVLAPNRMGGPIVTLDGKAIGINIARAGRVETYALPADVVQSLVKDLKAGKGSPTTKPAKEN